MRNKKELNTTISLLFTATPPLYRGVQRFEVLRFRQIFELSFAVLANRCAVSVRFCGPTSFGIWTPPVTKLQAKLRGSEGEGGGRRNLVKIRTNLKELSNFWLLSFVPVNVVLITSKLIHLNTERIVMALLSGLVLCILLCQAAASIDGYDGAKEGADLNKFWEEFLSEDEIGRSS